MSDDGLLPGLLDDLALLCMLRVPRIYHTRMRGVSSGWRRMVRSKEFYEHRKRRGILDTSIFFLPQFSTTPSDLECVEFDLVSEKKSVARFHNPAVTSTIFLEGHGCTAIGTSVLVFGGHFHGRSYGSLHIFDTVTRTWSQGAEMQFPRGDMAWGLLGGRLVVAGGWAGQGIGHRVETEVYNMETNEWSQLANVPHEQFTVDMFFVLGGRLYARGYNQTERLLNMVSYDLETDTWRKEADMLKHLEPVSPPLSLNRVAIKRSDNSLFLLEVKDCNLSPQAETEPVNLNIMKFNFRSGKWKKVGRVLDEVMHYDCECTFERDVRFLSMKDHVVFLTHSEEEEDIEVERLSGQRDVLRLSMLCPSNWSTTLVEA